MAPKKQKTRNNPRDISTFFGKENDAPGSSTPRRKVMASLTPSRIPLKVKDENGGGSGGHSHNFIVKLSSDNPKEFTVHCDQPRTIMEAARSNWIVSKEIEKCPNENFIIQLGEADKEAIVASHFPCSCISEGESVILWCQSEVVEKVQTKEPTETILPKDSYSVFYIDREGGLNTQKRKLFRSKAVKRYKFLLVYGEKEMTVEEILEKDGRFMDNLGEFTLSDNENPNRLTDSKQAVKDNLHQKAFKICFPQKKRDSGRKSRSSNLDVAHVRGISVNEAEKHFGISAEQVSELLFEQFPDQGEWMKSQFPGDSFQKELNLRKLNFGKIQQSFNEVHRVKKLLDMGKSVCKLIIQSNSFPVCTGTGFVLFDRFILTNAHLFKGYLEGKRLQEVEQVFALFNYEEEEPNSKYFYFFAEKTLVDIDDEMDYAVLELNPEGHRRTQYPRAENVKIPPGLLKKTAPLPKSGEACIIGHPCGSVKKMDPTWIIEAEKREQAINDHLALHQHRWFIVLSIVQTITNQGIEDIMLGGKNADKVGTYNTFMYHGSSGSPVFDAQCQVFGLHTAGYCYGFPGHEKSVIEYAVPLLTVVEKFVSNLKAAGNKQLLGKIEEVAKGNLYIKKILHPEPKDPEDPMDVN